MRIASKKLSQRIINASFAFILALSTATASLPFIGSDNANALPFTTYRLKPSAAVINAEAGTGVGSLYTFVEWKSFIGGWNDFQASLGSAAITATATGGAEVSKDSTNWSSSETVETSKSVWNKVEGSFYLKSDTVGTFPINLSATINTTEGERVLNETINLVTSDTTAPGQATNPSPTNGSVLNMDTLRGMGFSWTAPSDVSPITYEYGVTKAEDKDKLRSDGGFMSTVPNYNGNGRTGSSTPVPGNDLDDGEYYWKVRYTDASGNVGPWSDAWKFTIDSTAPSVEFTAPTPSNNTHIKGNFQIGYNISDTNLKFAQVAVYKDGETSPVQYCLREDNLTVNSKSGVCDVNGLTDGRYRLKLDGQDYAGKWVVVDRYITIDNTAPKVTNISIDPSVSSNIGRTVTVYFDLNDPSGIDLTRTRVLFADGPNTTNQNKESAKYTPVLVEGTANSYKVEINTLDFVKQNYVGSYNLQFNLYDGLGNQTSTKPSAFRPILIDNSGPSSALVSPTSGSTVGGVQRFIFEVTDHTGVGSGYVKFNGVSTKQYNLVHDSGDIWYADVDTENLIDGIYTIDARFVDSFGTPRYGANKGTVTIDNTAPVASITNPNDGDIVKGTTVLKGEVSDTNPMNSHFRIEGPNGYVKTDTKYNGLSLHEFTWNTASLTDGVYTIYFETRDKAQNKDGSTSSLGDSVDKVTVTVDNNGPLVAFTSPSKDQLISGDFTVTGTVSDDHSGVDYVIVPVYSHATGTNVYSQYATVNPDGTWELHIPKGTLADGMYDIRATARDNAGNSASADPRVRNIVVDNTAPVLTLADPSYTAVGNVITPIITVDNPDGLTYSWENTNEPDVVISDPTALTPEFTVNKDGTYSFVLTVTDLAGNETTQTFGFTYTTPVAPQSNADGDTDDDDSDDSGNFTDVIFGNTDDATEGEDVKGTQTTSEPEVKGVSDSNVWTLAGLAWYWWLLVLAILAFIGGLIAALRRRNQENA